MSKARDARIDGFWPIPGICGTVGSSAVPRGWLDAAAPLAAEHWRRWPRAVPRTHVLAAASTLPGAARLGRGVNWKAPDPTLPPRLWRFGGTEEAVGSGGSEGNLSSNENQVPGGTRAPQG